jgi:hypothetical protein
MTDLLRERGVFGSHAFVLVDVGCAGGIADPRRAFGPSLIAHGYDPDVAACEEAQAREPFPHVTYHARFVGLAESHPFVQRRRAEAERWPDRERLAYREYIARFEADPQVFLPSARVPPLRGVASERESLARRLAQRVKR